MIATVAALLALTVPYLPQTNTLCGGAAAAMVLRYWGDAHADVQAFAPLVDRRAGGIANDVLEHAVRERGWRVEKAGASMDALRARLDDGEPVIVLLADRGTRLHYVVVIDATETTVVVHDPAVGPSRPIPEADFERRWSAARFWSMVVLPVSSTAEAADASPAAIDPVVQAAPQATEDLCSDHLNRALGEIKAHGLDRADALLEQVRQECPDSAGPVRELSGVRFAQHRWAEAADLARQALEIDDRDAYTLDLLGSSLFMEDDYIGALRAWNRIGKPRVTELKIDGLRRARYQTIADALEIRPNMLMTADRFERAARRLRELPDRSTSRLSLSPEPDGFATVDVVLGERTAIPHGLAEWSATVIGAVIDREVTATVPGFTHQGETWSAGWRWWENRPAVTFAFATPHAGTLPGIWRVEAGWQSDAFAMEPQAAGILMRETRAHGALTMSDWLRGTLRYSMTAGFDSWNDPLAVTKAAAVGGTLEEHVFRDRVVLSADGARWIPVNGGAAFGSAAVRAAWSSSLDPRGWTFSTSAGAQQVSDAAPLDLWPGAGNGHARAPLLRAHPLIEDGVIDLSGHSVFGRSLAYGSVETVRWLAKPPIARVGLAAFVDVAGASRALPGVVTPAQADAGVGLRIKIPGSSSVVRIDYGHGLRDGADALTFGIIK